MPIYEYRCPGCGRRFSLLVRQPAAAPPSCPACGSQGVVRLFSTFAVRRTDRDIYEDVLSDTRLIRAMEANDPKALTEWNRRMSRGLDTEETEPEYKDMIEKMERGEMPGQGETAAEDAAGETGEE